MKQIVKTLNNFVKKTIFKVQNKTNINFKIYNLNIVKNINKFIEKTILKAQNKTNINSKNSNLNIVKNFNKFAEKTILKVQNKTNNNFKISNFNKYLITLISLLFFYLFYLSIPVLYDKTWVQSNIEKQLFSEFKINFSISSDISYNILPTPHFLIKNSKIFNLDDESPRSLAEIKSLKVFISQANLFDKEKMNINKVVINKANFLLLGKDIKLLNDYTNDKFSLKKIKVNNSNIFFKGKENETISIIKIFKASLFLDDEKLLNLFKLNGEVFNIPFAFSIKKEINFPEQKVISFYAKMLKLYILDESTIKDEKFIIGENTISFLNSKILTKYNIKENSILFESDNSNIKNPNAKHNGQLTVNPFDLKLNIYYEKYKLSKLLNLNSMFIELLKTKLLFNENISISTSFNTTSQSKEEIFQSTKIIMNIINGKINFDESIFINNKIGILNITNSNLFYENNRLLINTDIKIDIKNLDSLFSFLQTPKKARKPLKNIFINLDYDFLTNQIVFNNLKINDNEVNDELFRIIGRFNDNSINNMIKSRRVLNDLISAYEFEG